MEMLRGIANRVSGARSDTDFYQHTFFEETYGMRQEELQELQSKISDASAFIRPLRTEIGRIVAGQEQLVDRVLLALIANGHLLL